MAKPKRRNVSLSTVLPLNWLWRQRRQLFWVIASFGGILLSGWLLLNTFALQSAATGSVDAFLVLGGSIQREIYTARLAKQYPAIPVLISQGSPKLCVQQVFQQIQSPMENVWLEECANSTFGNFYFSVPILHHWGVHKVRFITSSTHLPRAQWMAQLLLGAHGIWVEPDIIYEEGIPGNHESRLKTGLDLTRSLLWAVLSQFIEPHCSRLIKLANNDVNGWSRQQVNCEHYVP